MDQIFFENRDYFVKRLEDLENLLHSSKKNRRKEALAETPDTAVCVRIRPLLDFEVKKEHIKGVLTDNYETVNIHEPKRKIANRKPDLNISSFTLDQVYGSERKTKDIYEDRVQALVEWVQQGGTSLLLAYGQTGSGKTFTVAELQRLVVGKLMDGDSSSKWDLQISIFEVAGSNMCDLLQDRKTIKALEDSFGTVQLASILEKNPKTSKEFLDLIDIAKELRSTESTSKNDQSSRSHAICRIRVVNNDSPDSPEGTFLLVDLAGSEAGTDTQNHSRERTIEAIEINKSLTTLKDCIRARALWSLATGEAAQKQIRIPFRGAKLTQVLKSALDVNSSRTCKTVIIACVSPSILDVAQSKNTLRYAEMLKILVPKAKPRAFDARTPTTWTNKDVHEWIKKNSGTPQINPSLLAPKEDGTELCRLKEDEFVARALLTHGVQHEKAKLLYFKLWALHIDSRSLPPSSGTPDKTILTKTVPNDVQKSRMINPGEFFQLNEHFSWDGIKMVMVMASAPQKTSGNKEVSYICAAVRPSRGGVEGAYELFVADQKIVKAQALEDEVMLQYDGDTRYYYVRE